MAVVAPDGTYSKAYQFVSKESLPRRGFAGQLGVKRDQLLAAPATERHLVAEYINATMADYLARKADLDMSLSAFRASVPEIEVRVELRDGTI
jgi:hypothetical protein